MWAVCSQEGAQPRGRLQFCRRDRDGPQIGSGTPRPKTISARDSSAQIDFFTGTPRPGTPRPSYKNPIFVANNGKQMYI